MVENGHMQDDREKSARAALVLNGAERGPRLSDLPADLIPQDEESAYATQEAALGSDLIAGWKVAAIQVPKHLTYAAIGQARFLREAVPPHLLHPEFEVEIAIRIARDLPPRDAAYGSEEVLAALGDAHAAIEVIESRFANRKTVSPLSALADSLSCSGVIIGSGTSDWQELDFTALKLTLGGHEPIAEASGNATVAQTVLALTSLANHASRRGAGLRTGEFVITGARIGPLPVKSGQRLVARVEHIGEVALVV